MYNRSKITYPHGNKTAKGSRFKKIAIGVRHTLLKRVPGTEKNMTKGIWVVLFCSVNAIDFIF